MEKLINHFLSNVEHLEGSLLYIAGAITVTWVHITNKDNFIKGLKGDNELFEAPEIVIYLFSWIFPHIIMQQFFLVDDPSVYAWSFLAVLLLFTLTGRWGLEWLASIKNGTTVKQETKNESSSIDTTTTTTTSQES